MKKLFYLPIFLLSFYFPAISQSNYIKDWLIIGPFQNRNASQILKDKYIDEERIIPNGGLLTNGLIWIRYNSPFNHIDFHDPILAIDPIDYTVIYCAFFVFAKSPNNINKTLFLGSDDGISVICNGKEVYYNHSIRGFSYNSDKVVIELKPGWNTILIKVSNITGGYAVSARFENDEHINIQAENPFKQKDDDSRQPEISVVQNNKLNQFVLNDNNELIFSTNRTYLNKSEFSIKDLRIVMLLENEEIFSSNIPKISGGELFSFKYSIPIEKLLNNSNDNIKVKILKKKKEVFPDTSYNTWQKTSCVENLFSAIRLGAWKKTRDRDNYVFTKTVSVPKPLEGFGIDVSADIGAVMSVMKVNDKIVKTKFWEESGDIHITTNAKFPEKFKIEIIATPKDKNGEDVVLRNSFIYFRNPSAEKTIGNLYYAKNILNRYPADLIQTYSGIFNGICKKDQKIIDNLLTDVEAKSRSALPSIKNLNIHHIGHAHIDMAWLWRYPETIEVTRQTFQAAIDNMHTFPDFKISHGQAQSYYWIEKYYPELFKEVQKYVLGGRWEIVGGSWVESDGNMPSGEFLIRQYAMAKRYFKEKFNVDVEIGFYPDTFGHCESMPMILDKCGIKIYVFFRPVNEQRIGYWQYKNGSRILAHRPPEWYNSSGAWNRSNAIPDPGFYKHSFSTSIDYKLSDVLRFYGVGDHGGGPTIKEIENIHTLDNLTAYPKCVFGTLKEYYEKILNQNSNFEIYNGEINPVFEGCYTSQAKTKYNNRKAEFFLPAVETFSTIAGYFDNIYPKDTIDEAWRRVLMNQFHDILPGSGIGGVYTDAEAFYDTAFTMCETALIGAFDKIGSQINTNTSDKKWIPLILFNSLNWQRSFPVQIRTGVSSAVNAVKIFDSQNKLVKSQIISSEKDSVGFVFIADKVPSVGYKTYWIELNKGDSLSGQPLQDNLTLENKFYKLEIDKNTGSIKRIFDKTNIRELLPYGSLANQYQIQDDAGDAWVISLQGTPKVINQPLSIKLIESGDIRKTLKIEYEYLNSKFSQYIILYDDLPAIYFYNEIDWKERNKILKISFPLDIENGTTTYDIPFGTIQRPNDGKEYVMQKYVDHSNKDFGITILNDSKYGCDVNKNVVRITALRSPKYPDPLADSAFHSFGYALFSHNKFNNNQIMRSGFEFNSPLLPYIANQHWGKLPNSYSFYDKYPENIIVTAIKKSETDNSTIMRFYETEGKETIFNLTSFKNIKKIFTIDPMEWKSEEIPKEKKKNDIKILPYDLKTLKIYF